MKQVLIAFDQFLNTLVPPFSDAWADETLSSRCWRHGRDFGGAWGIARKFVDTLFFWQSQHCFQAYISEWERKQLPPEFRDKKRITYGRSNNWRGRG